MRIGKNIDSLKFSEEIEEIIEQKDVSYFEAVMLYCEANGLEIETIARLVKHNTTIKAKLAEECEDLRLIKKTARLPI